MKNKQYFQYERFFWFAVFCNRNAGEEYRIIVITNQCRMALAPKDANHYDPLQKHHNRNDHNQKFYQQYRKIFATGYHLSAQLKQLVDSKDGLWKKLLTYQKRTEQEFRDKMRKEAPERKKRFRRTDNQIEKSYHCHSERCNRSYGSEGSLLQHLKLKHPEKYDQMLSTTHLRHQLEQLEQPEQLEQLEQLELAEVEE